MFLRFLFRDPMGTTQLKSHISVCNTAENLSMCLSKTRNLNEFGLCHSVSSRVTCVLHLRELDYTYAFPFMWGEKILEVQAIIYANLGQSSKAKFMPFFDSCLFCIFILSSREKEVFHPPPESLHHVVSKPGEILRMAGDRKCSVLRAKQHCTLSMEDEVHPRGDGVLQHAAIEAWLPERRSA